MRHDVLITHEKIIYQNIFQNAYFNISPANSGNGNQFNKLGFMKQKTEFQEIIVDSL